MALVVVKALSIDQGEATGEIGNDARETMANGSEELEQLHKNKLSEEVKLL